MRVRWVLRLYPRAWRRAYGEELAAVLDQHDATLATLGDLLRSAAEAQLETHFGEGSMVVQTLADRTVLRAGLVSGGVLGALQVVYTLLNNLANPDARLNSILNTGLTLGLLAGPAVVGFLGAWYTRRAVSGVAAAVVSFALSALLGFGTLWLVTLLCMDTIRHNTFLLQDFQRSGMHDLDAFIIDDALGATFFGGLLGLAACIVCGTTGGVLGKVARRGARP